MYYDIIQKLLTILKSKIDIKHNNNRYITYRYIIHLPNSEKNRYFLHAE